MLSSELRDESVQDDYSPNATTDPRAWRMSPVVPAGFKKLALISVETPVMYCPIQRY